MENIINYIETIPAPNSKIEELFLLQKQNLDINRLIKIIEEDAFLVNRIFNLVNSKYFGFSVKIHSVSRAVNLFGLNFCIPICIAQLVLCNIRFDLKAYDIGINEFNKILDMSLKFVFDFLKKDEIEIKQKLILPIFLQHIGKFILSSFLQKVDNISFFKSQTNIYGIDRAEFRTVNMNSTDITSKILKNWGFPIEIINTIDETQNIKDYQSSRVNQTLNIVNTLFFFKNILTEESIKSALRKGNEYNMDIGKLKELSKKYHKKYYKVK